MAETQERNGHPWVRRRCGARRENPGASAGGGDRGPAASPLAPRQRRGVAGGGGPPGAGAGLGRRSRRGSGEVSLEAVARWARSLPAGVVAFDESRRITLFTQRA